MARLRGKSIGSGLVLGTVAIIEELNGIPVAPQPPARVIKEQILRRGAAEKPDIILAGRDARTAVTLAPLITWGRVVAVVSETTAFSAGMPGVPCVGDIEGLLDSLREDMLLLVDASGGFLFPDPDPVFLAHYTATAANLSPKKRIYLDDGHEPVRTQDGVLIQVMALADGPEEAETAAACGADGLLLGADAGAASEALVRAASASAAGKELLALHRSQERADYLLEYGLSHLITVLFCIDDAGSMARAEASYRAMQERVSILIDADEPASMPSTAVAIRVEMAEQEGRPPEEIISEVLDWCEKMQASRLVLGIEAESFGEGLLGLMDPWIVAATNRAMPIYAVCRSVSLNPFGFGTLENSLTCAARLLIGAGIAGIAVYPQDVQALKSVVREENMEECRTAFRDALKEIFGL
jgi:hypothetical protein